MEGQEPFEEDGESLNSGKQFEGEATSGKK